MHYSPSARVRVSDSENVSESKQLLVAKNHPNVVDCRKVATQFLEQFLNEQLDIPFLAYRCTAAWDWCMCDVEYK